MTTLDTFLAAQSDRCSCGAHRTLQAELCHCERNHTLDATVDAHAVTAKRIEAVVRELASLDGTFSANHPKLQAVLSQADSSKVAGAVFASLSKRGVITKVGIEESVNPSTRGAVVKVWKGRAA